MPSAGISLSLATPQASSSGQETFDRISGPSTPWLAAGFILAGLGTALLGPILPYVARAWHLSDAASGTLFLAKFIGAFLGGVSVARRLRLGIFLGSLLCTAGFGGFALCSNAYSGALMLLVGGFGLGQIIAATNILAGRRFDQHTGSALASLNFFWALGAVATGVLAAASVPRFGLARSLLVFASFFLATGLGGWISAKESASNATPTSIAATPLPPTTMAFFALLLFLYGGLETCLTSWLTTFSLRFADTQMLGGQSAVVLFWSALTAGRLLASGLLRWVSERTAQALTMALATVLVVGVSLTHHALNLTVECIALGLVLAPYFPAVFGLLMRRNPPARSAGLILAVSGLGAAFFPWLMGILSTVTHSLRLAMLVPAAIALLMLLLSRFTPNPAPSASFPTGEREANVVSS